MDICIDGGKEGLAGVQDLGVQLGVGTREKEEGVLEVVDIRLGYAEV